MNMFKLPKFREVALYVAIIVVVLTAGFFGKKFQESKNSISVTPMCDLYIYDAQNGDIEISTADIIAFSEKPGISELTIRLKPGSAPRREYTATEDAIMHQERMDYLRTCKLGGF